MADDLGWLETRRGAVAADIATYVWRGESAPPTLWQLFYAFDALIGQWHARHRVARIVADLSFEPAPPPPPPPPLAPRPRRERRPTPPPRPIDVVVRYGLPSDRVDCSLASTAPPWQWTWAESNVPFSDMPLYGIRRDE